MQTSIDWDNKTEDWIDGYLCGTSGHGTLAISFDVGLEEDPLYAIQRFDDIWYIINTKHALSWGL